VPELTPEQINALLSIVLPPTAARAGWEFDVTELLEAKQVLRIHKPIHFRWTSPRRRNGTHYVAITPGFQLVHKITLNQNGHITDANATLWHEIAHAYQAERWAESTGRSIRHFYQEAYKPARGAHGASYQDNAYEIHARKMADANKHVMLLKERKQ